MKTIERKTKETSADLHRLPIRFTDRQEMEDGKQGLQKH